jgi:hypothetical protein
MAGAHIDLAVHGRQAQLAISARAPAGNVNRKKGSEATVDMREIKNGDQRVF